MDLKTEDNGRKEKSRGKIKGGHWEILICDRGIHVPWTSGCRRILGTSTDVQPDSQPRSYLLYKLKAFIFSFQRDHGYSHRYIQVPTYLRYAWICTFYACEKFERIPEHNRKDSGRWV